MKLGSLFDGIGGFPLAATVHGIAKDKTKRDPYQFRGVSRWQGPKKKP